MGTSATSLQQGTSHEIALQHSIGGVELMASVDLIGGGLRALAIGGVDLIETYPAGGAPPFCAGALLFPWPNRVRDGRWTQHGVDHQLFVTEPDLGNATHGLVLAAPFAVEQQVKSEVTISTSVAPQPGYPFLVRLKVTYRLTDDGLEVTYMVSNESNWPAPVALGVHPYIRIGDVPVADLTVHIGAHTYFPMDAQLIPIDEQPVTDTVFDLSEGQKVGDSDLNTCYGAVRTVDGRSRHVVAAPDGRAVELWADEAFAYVQVYTCPIFPRAARTGRAIAIEPMTAPADALNSGVGLRWLDPRNTWEMSWGIRPAGTTEGWALHFG